MDGHSDVQQDGRVKQTGRISPCPHGSVGSLRSKAPGLSGHIKVPIFIGRLRCILEVGSHRSGGQLCRFRFMKSAPDLASQTSIIVIQAVFNTWQDYSTGNIMASIAGLLPMDIFVKRDGEKFKLPAADLVLGDIVTITLGSKVPADLHILDVSSDLCFDWSILPGESNDAAATLDCTDKNYCVSVAVAFIPGLPQSHRLFDEYVLTFLAIEGLPVCVTLSLTIIAHAMRSNSILCKSLMTIESLGAIDFIASQWDLNVCTSLYSLTCLTAVKCYSGTTQYIDPRCFGHAVFSRDRMHTSGKYGRIRANMGHYVDRAEIRMNTYSSHQILIQKYVGPRRGYGSEAGRKIAFEVSTAADNPDNPAPSNAPPTRGRGRGRGRGIGGRGGNSRRGGKHQGKEYAESHGQKWGWFRGINDGIKTLEDSDTEIPADAPAEGIYAVPLWKDHSAPSSPLPITRFTPVMQKYPTSC
ncbi:E1-E2 ATPase-domain-containing protein [Mycena albidolilacea]|uniref:E1-E2 ATPase-domain-containing protein n=1 Tax=Mycena albidolilacea TaxID=1033008 RepID=A0AAD6ZQ98_9AGAR|nr:E1-E2 ATPase-domain-containing protein [Mycena albidolilacea]